jgi:hypothetical protein
VARLWGKKSDFAIFRKYVVACHKNIVWFLTFLLSSSTCSEIWWPLPMSSCGWLLTYLPHNFKEKTLVPVSNLLFCRRLIKGRILLSSAMCWERLDSLLEVSGKLLTTLKYSHSIPVQSKSLKGFQKGLQKPTQSIIKNQSLRSSINCSWKDHVFVC